MSGTSPDCTSLMVVADMPIHGSDGALLDIVGVSERVSYLTSR